MPRRPYEKEYTPEPPYDEYEKSKPCEKHDKKEKCECHFDLGPTITITQSNEATTGNGGDNTEANVQVAQAIANGNASAENSASDAHGDAAPADSKETNQDLTPPQEENAKTNKAIISVGSGGNVSQSNVAEVDITQCVIIPCCDGKGGPPQAYNIGLSGKKLDITMDEQGNTFVNGKKMDVEKLDDGTNVFLFKNHIVKKDGELGV